MGSSALVFAEIGLSHSKEQWHCQSRIGHQWKNLFFTCRQWLEEEL